MLLRRFTYKFLWGYTLSILLSILGVALLDHMVTLDLAFLTAVFQSNCTILYFHQQYIKGPTSPHPMTIIIVLTLLL